MNRWGKAGVRLTDQQAEHRARAAVATRNQRKIVTTAGRSKVVDSFGYSVSETDDESSAPWFTHPHIARWDPARALAEVDAKRKILEIHHRIECQHDRNFSTGGDCAECGGEYPCETVRLLALPYADRPGFPDEWKP